MYFYYDELNNKLIPYIFSVYCHQTFKLVIEEEIQTKYSNPELDIQLRFPDDVIQEFLENIKEKY